MMEKFRCTMCHEEHDIDKYGWIQCSVLGYIDLESFIFEMEKWVANRLAQLEKLKK